MPSIWLLCHFQFTYFIPDTAKAFSNICGSQKDEYELHVQILWIHVALIVYLRLQDFLVVSSAEALNILMTAVGVVTMTSVQAGTVCLCMSTVICIYSDTKGVSVLHYDMMMLSCGEPSFNNMLRGVSVHFLKDTTPVKVKEQTMFGE